MRNWSAKTNYESEDGFPFRRPVFPPILMVQYNDMQLKSSGIHKNYCCDHYLTAGTAALGL